jgi:hypothetical protein
MIEKVISSKANLDPVLLIVGVAWLVMMGIQSLPQLVGYGKYYPDIEQSVIKSSLQKFEQFACPDERQQLERIMVIGSATNNFFVVLILSFPVWIWRFCELISSAENRALVWGGWRTNARTVIVAYLGIVTILGLYNESAAYFGRAFVYMIAKASELPHDCNSKTETHK